jgi:hypothetical protein
LSRAVPSVPRVRTRLGLLQPEDLRVFIDKHGKAEAMLQLSPFRKGPPQQDLV